MFFSKLSENPETIGGGPAADDRNAGVVQRVASLAMYSKMSAIARRYRRSFGLLGAAELSAEPRFDFIAEAGDLPLLDEELQTRALAILAIAFVAKHRRDGCAQVDHFVWLDQHTQVF